jgi:phosphocarrier protein HPr
VSDSARQLVRVVNDLGMHLRAAGALVQLAGRFRADIFLEYQGSRVNGKSIMSVLSLAASRGSEILVAADGDDAKDAVRAIVELIEHGFSVS